MRHAAIASLWLALQLALLCSVASAAASFRLVARTGMAATAIGGGVQYNRFENVASNEFGDAVFRATLTGSGVSSTNQSALIFASRNGTTRLIARSGSTPPGAPENSRFSDYFNVYINSQGEVAFENQMLPTGANLNKHDTIWLDSGGLSLVGYGTHERFNQASEYHHGYYLNIHGFNPAGDVLYRSGEYSSSGSTIITGDAAFWFKSKQSPLRLVAREDDSFTLNSSTATYDYLYEQSSLLSNGRVIYSAQLTGAGIDNSNNDTIWRDDNGQKQILVRDGQGAPGMASGVTLTHITMAKADESGQLAYRSRIAGTGVTSANNEALFSTAGGTPHLVARHGTRVLVDGKWTTITSLGSEFSPEFGVSGDSTHFRAVYDGARTGEGVFVEQDGVIRALARSGQPAPGMPGFTLDGYARPYINPTSGRAIVRSDVLGPTRNGNGIWMEDENLELQPVIHTGSLVPIGNTLKEVDWAFVHPIISFSNIAIHVLFTDDTDAILMWNGEISAPVAMPGDFNGDAVVNATDYVVWSMEPMTSNRRTNYYGWLENYGARPVIPIALSAGGAAVPEPGALMLVLHVAFAAAGATARLRGISREAHA